MSSVNESTKKDLRTEHFKPLELNVSKHFWPTVPWILILTCVLCKRELNMFKWTNNWMTQAQYTDYTRELLRNDHGDGDPDGNENGKKAIIKFRLTKHLCTCMALFWTFLWRFYPTATWNCLISLLVEVVSTRQRLPFSLTELRSCPLEVKVRKICQHLTNWTRRNNQSVPFFRPFNQLII